MYVLHDLRKYTNFLPIERDVYWRETIVEYAGFCKTIIF